MRTRATRSAVAQLPPPPEEGAGPVPRPTYSPHLPPTSHVPPGNQHAARRDAVVGASTGLQYGPGACPYGLVSRNELSASVRVRLRAVTHGARGSTRWSASRCVLAVLHTVANGGRCEHPRWSTGGILGEPSRGSVPENALEHRSSLVLRDHPGSLQPVAMVRRPANTPRRPASLGYLSRRRTRQGGNADSAARMEEIFR